MDSLHLTNDSEPTARRQRSRLVVVCAILVVVVVVVAVLLFREGVKTPTVPLDGPVDVPLGVEEAVIVRFAGPTLIARPYRRGASVSVRIARRVEQQGVQVYDVRYVVNLPGEFDLTDYLTSNDGTSIKSLPAFRVRGVTRLTKDMETRIREIEEVKIDVWHWYYESLAGLSVFWFAWLLGLIFIGRSKRRPPPQPQPEPPPSQEAQIDRLLQRLPDEELTVEEKAELEVLLLAYWKESMGFDGRLADMCAHLRHDPEVGRAYGALESWLHCPDSEVEAQQIASLCRPRVVARSEGAS